VTVGEVVATVAFFRQHSLFFASSKNKRRIASIFIDMKKWQVLQGTPLNNQSLPGVGVKIHL
jgi:hypothetical protein